MKGKSLCVGLLINSTKCSDNSSDHNKKSWLSEIGAQTTVFGWKTKAVSPFIEFLRRWKKVSNTFLCQIITTNQTCLYKFDPETTGAWEQDRPNLPFHSHPQVSTPPGLYFVLLIISLWHVYNLRYTISAKHFLRQTFKKNHILYI